MDGMLKYKMSRLYELSMRLWPDEFKKVYTAKRTVFRDWLNGKTGLKEDHLALKEKAIDAWLEKLESMVHEKG